MAERTLHVSTSSIGRFIGGALLIPTISSRMGGLLFRLAGHSSLLRAFLAIKDRPAPGAAPPSPLRLFGPGGAGAGRWVVEAGGGWAGCRREHHVCGHAGVERAGSGVVEVFVFVSIFHSFLAVEWMLTEITFASERQRIACGCCTST